MEVNGEDYDPPGEGLSKIFTQLPCPPLRFVADAPLPGSNETLHVRPFRSSFLFSRWNRQASRRLGEGELVVQLGQYLLARSEEVGPFGQQAEGKEDGPGHDVPQGFGLKSVPLTTLAANAA